MKKQLIITTIFAIAFSLVTAVSESYAQSPSGAGQNQSASYEVSQPPIIPQGASDVNDTSKSSVAPLQLPGVGTDTGLGLPDLVLPNITNIIIGITGGLSLLFTIIGGIQALTAYGNEEQLGKAKKTITWSLLGLVVALLSYAIVQIIISIKIQ